MLSDKTQQKSGNLLASRHDSHRQRNPHVPYPEAKYVLYAANMLQHNKAVRVESYIACMAVPTSQTIAITVAVIFNLGHSRQQYLRRRLLVAPSRLIGGSSTSLCTELTGGTVTGVTTGLASSPLTDSAKSLWLKCLFPVTVMKSSMDVIRLFKNHRVQNLKQAHSPLLSWINQITAELFSNLVKHIDATHILMVEQEKKAESFQWLGFPEGKSKKKSLITSVLTAPGLSFDARG